MSGWDKAIKAAEVAKKALDFASEHKLASSALSALGQTNAAAVADKLGLGKKKRKRGASKSRKPMKKAVSKRRRGKKGGSFLGDILGKITSIPVGLGVGGILGAQGAISGLGRKRRRVGGFFPTTSAQRGTVMY